jgi:transcriptional regulator with XRE-family HTH domain
MLNRVESNETGPDIERPDPEVQAGRALRRLRLLRGWSQEEVAKRMQAFGYEFHQTMVAKIEAAQRPLRVRELADFAALYGVEVQELIYAPSGSLEEVTQEIVEFQHQLLKARQQAEACSAELKRAHDALSDAQMAYDSSLREVSVLKERLDFLQQENDTFASQETSIFRAAGKPDPFAARSPMEFHAALQEFRSWAGNPSFRMMAQRSKAEAAAISAVMRRGAMPDAPMVRAIIEGCGGSEDDVLAFVEARARTVGS